MTVMHPAHLSRIDLNLVPALVALLDERHVSRAATRMGLSQPAMSRALQRLRRLFDDELLVRSAQGYALTPRAERIREQLTGVLEDLDQVFGPDTFEPATASRTIRVAVTDYTVSTFGSVLAQRILTESPQSTVSFDIVDDRVFDKLDAGGIDLVALGRMPPERFHVQQLFTDHFVCVVAAEHRLAGRRSITLAEYLRWPHLVIDIEHGAQPGVDPALQQLRASRRVGVTTPFHVVAPATLPDTDLVLTFPARLVPLYVDPARTRVLRAPREIPEFPIYAVWHPRMDADPWHRWLRDAVREVTAAAPPADC